MGEAKRRKQLGLYPSKEIDPTQIEIYMYKAMFKTVQKEAETIWQGWEESCSEGLVNPFMIYENRSSVKEYDRVAIFNGDMINFFREKLGLQLSDYDFSKVVRDPKVLRDRKLPPPTIFVNGSIEQPESITYIRFVGILTEETMNDPEFREKAKNSTAFVERY